LTIAGEKMRGGGGGAEGETPPVGNVPQREFLPFDSGGGGGVETDQG